MGDLLVVAVCSFLSAFLYGAFLSIITRMGLEHEQAFTALAHPGYKHFVRLHIHQDGHIKAYVIGKDNPIGKDDSANPKLIDSFEWSPEKKEKNRESQV